MAVKKGTKFFEMLYQIIYIHLVCLFLGFNHVICKQNFTQVGVIELRSTEKTEKQSDCPHVLRK